MITLFYLLEEESEMCRVIITVTFFDPCLTLGQLPVIGNQFAFQNTGTIMTMMWQSINNDK